MVENIEFQTRNFNEEKEVYMGSPKNHFTCSPKVVHFNSFQPPPPCGQLDRRLGAQNLLSIENGRRVDSLKKYRREVN